MKPAPSTVRSALWAAAEATVLERLTSAKFLYGTFVDRQTGALKTHRWRQQAGVHQVAPADHAGVDTRGSDGESRWSSWCRNEQAGLAHFMFIADKMKFGAYRPDKLRIKRIEYGDGKERVIAIPTVTDRTLQAVILEVLEPVIDPMLSNWQHGYRPSAIDGHPLVLPDLQGVARGSTLAVALRLKRALGDGYSFMAEVDICKAFPSVQRKRLARALEADGCSRSLAGFLMRMLGDVGASGVKASVPFKGLPLGSPYSPLLFNFYVKDVQQTVHSRKQGIRIVSYADNFFIAAKDQLDLSEAVRDLLAVLGDLGFKAEVKQEGSTSARSPFRILVGKREGGFELYLGNGGDVVLCGTSGRSIANKPLVGESNVLRSVLGGKEVDNGLCGLGNVASGEVEREG